MPSSNQQPSSAESGRRFATTRWSTVLAAQQEGTAGSETALATLCETYWFPLYGYVRRQGYQPAEAQDLTPAFFARLLEKNDLREVGRDRGKFRSFLLIVWYFSVSPLAFAVPFSILVCVVIAILVWLAWRTVRVEEDRSAGQRGTPPKQPSGIREGGRRER
ncbi:MAG: hypothetical protein WD049_02290 [Candidatus Paceibacterota bacterium]